ncbi:MAG TPA: NUDIX domain-containing protein [Gemmatimonadales bacterium]
MDTYAVRGAGEHLEILTLRRAQRRNIGSWETIHGTIEPGERPEQASLRELHEETGLVPEKFYNLSRTEAFYQHRTGEMALIPVFVAFVARAATVRLSEEHDRAEWLAARDAAARFAWPRERRAVEDILSIVGGGDAGLLEDVLRVS